MTIGELRNLIAEYSDDQRILIEDELDGDFRDIQSVRPTDTGQSAENEAVIFALM